MKYKNSLISISLATILVGCGSSNGSGGMTTNLQSKILGDTILNNELIYNQVIDSKTIPAVEAYVKEKFGNKNPTSQNLKDVETAVKNAKAAHPDANPSAVTAAVINKVMTMVSSNPQGIKDITVTDNEIQEADIPSLAKLEFTESLSKNVDEEIKAQIDPKWVDSKDASISKITAKNGKIVAASHYHNALTVIDITSGDKVFSPVSVITDSGHGKDSTSGASENYLRNVVLNSDSSYVYANIPPKGASSKTADTATIGLYKVKIEDDGSIATTTDTTGFTVGERVSIDLTNSKRLNKIVSKYAVASDDSKVVVLDSEKNLFVYDGDLTNEIAAIESDGFDAIAVEGDTVFVANDKNITKLSAETLTGNEKIILGFKPAEIIINSDASKLVAFNHGHDNKGITDIAIVNLADGSINASNTKFTSDTAVISPDFSKMALVGHESSDVMILNLTVPNFSVQGLFPAEGVRDAEFLDNDKLAIINGRNSVGMINITTTTQNINLDTKIELAKKGLNRSSINGGGYLNAIIKDVSLNSAYENVGISWTSTLPTGVLNPANGEVTRPTNEAQDESGKLQAALTASFRSTTKIGNKEFDINIRKVPVILPTPKSVETGIAQYMAANGDGSILVAPIQATFGEETKYGLASYSVNEAGEISVATEPKRFADDEEVVGVGVNGVNAFAITKKEEFGRIFSVAVGQDGTLAADATNSLDITTGTPSNVEWNNDNSKAIVFVKEDDDTFLAEIYDVDASGNITINSTIDMGDNKEYKTYGPPAINNEGDRAFQRDGEKVYAVDANGVVASAEVEEIARVWYAHQRVIVNTYDGNIFSFNEDLQDKKIFSTGTGGRMYGAEGRVVDGENKLMIPVQRSDKSLNGIYILNIADDGTISEESFSNEPSGADRMAVSGDGKRVFFNYTNSDKKRQMAVVTIP